MHLYARNRICAKKGFTCYRYFIVSASRWLLRLVQSLTVSRTFLSSLGFCHVMSNSLLLHCHIDMSLARAESHGSLQLQWRLGMLCMGMSGLSETDRGPSQGDDHIVLLKKKLLAWNKQALDIRQTNSRVCHSDYLDIGDRMGLTGSS